MTRFQISQAAAQRRQRVLELRKAGVNFTTIAREVKVSRKQVVNDFKRAADEAACGRLITVTTERALELHRLETALLALVSKVQKGDLPSIDRWLRICESRRKLLGLNARPRRGRRSANFLKSYVGVDIEKV